MSNFKRKLILISGLIVFSLHLYCFVESVNIYPFVEYNMFSKMKTSPHYKTLYLYGIDSAGNEFSLDHDKKFFFKPFNQRGFYHALYNTIQYKGSKNTLIPLVKIANRFNPLVNGLQLYTFCWTWNNWFVDVLRKIL